MNLANSDVGSTDMNLILIYNASTGWGEIGYEALPSTPTHYGLFYEYYRK